MIVGYPGVRVVGLVEGDVVRDAAYKTVSKSLSVGVSQNPFGVTRRSRFLQKRYFVAKIHFPKSEVWQRG